jgi:hypothetical protein
MRSALTELTHKLVFGYAENPGECLMLPEHHFDWELGREPLGRLAGLIVGTLSR